MIGAFTFKLRAQNSARLTMVNGRLMHAAFFKLLHLIAPDIEKYIHDELNIKPFTVSFLEPKRNLKVINGAWQIPKGSEFLWRVTVLDAQIFEAILSVNSDFEIQAANLSLSIEGTEVGENFSKEEFTMAAKNFRAANAIQFRFVSPTTFRIDDADAPYPKPDLIFASLADKWTQSNMPAAADKRTIQQLATSIRLTEWEGRSRKFYFAHDRGTLAFYGTFTLDLTAVDTDLRRVFMLLARFAEFSGVGRLTAQGFGQTRVEFFA